MLLGDALVTTFVGGHVSGWYLPAHGDGWFIRYGYSTGRAGVPTVVPLVSINLVRFGLVSGYRAPAQVSYTRYVKSVACATDTYLRYAFFHT